MHAGRRPGSLPRRKHEKSGKAAGNMRVSHGKNMLFIDSSDRTERKCRMRNEIKQKDIVGIRKVGDTYRVEPGYVGKTLAVMGVNDVPQNNPHHYLSLYGHTEAVVQAMLDVEGKEISKPAFIAAVTHDAGKEITRGVNIRTGYDKFWDHADVSLGLCKIHADKLGLDKPEDLDYVCELVRLHDAKPQNPGMIRVMLDSHPNGFAKDLISLEYADSVGQSDFDRATKLTVLKNFSEAIIKNGRPEQTRGIQQIVDKHIVPDIQKAREREVEMAADSKTWLARTATGEDVYKVSAEDSVHRSHCTA